MVTGLALRDTEEGKIKGMHFQTFFGGGFPASYPRTFLALTRVTNCTAAIVTRSRGRLGIVKGSKGVVRRRFWGCYILSGAGFFAHKLYSSITRIFLPTAVNIAIGRVLAGTQWTQ